MSGSTRRLALVTFCLLLLGSATQLRAQGTTVSPSSINFGDQLVGTTSPATAVTVKNTGTTSITVTSVTAPSPFSAGTACNSKKLAPNATCSFNVTFKPMAPGFATGTLTVAFAAPIASQTVSLSGTGIEPIATVSATSLSFGNEQVGTTSTAQPVTLSNTGTAPLQVNGISINGTNPGNFAQTNTCGPFPATLAINASCTITLTFTPNTTGTRSANLAINVAKPATNQTVALSGVGVAPSASLNPTTLSFGNQAVGTTSAAQVVTLSNTGIGPLSISSIGIGGMNPGSFGQTNTCGNTLAVNGSCPISVTFKPGSTGSKSASLQAHDGAGTQSASLSGTGTTSGGVPPAFTSATSTTFTVGIAGSFTVTTTGTPTPTLSEAGTLPAGVTFAAATGVLSGTPSTAGTFAITFTATNSAGTATQSFTLTVNKGTASVTLGNLTQTYNGNALTPTVTTAPPNLATTLTGAPDTNAGTYPVTATVNDPNYTGSANGSFVINKAAATVTLGNLTQTYTGSPLSPTVTTTPSGLATTLTGAPDTNAGTYPVTATVNDPNYTGSANGSFAIGQATPVFSNLTPSQSITYGTSSISLSGTLAAGSVYPPSGEPVSITIANSTASPTLGANGALSTNFMTGSIAASSTPYTITYSYGGDANFAAATDASTTLTVTQAGPALQSITVTPSNASVAPSATVQFTATGSYSDGSTQDLTSSVSWMSFNTDVATISSSGLATGVTVGITNIQAISGPISSNYIYITVPGPGTGGFVATGSMNVARDPFTATLLNNGTVLMAGGIGVGSLALSSAELYDAGGQASSPVSSMTGPRAYHTATLLNNGMVLIVGGCDGSSGCSGNDALSSAELYDPTQKTFTPTGSMSYARVNHTATLLSNGTVLIVGGYNCCQVVATAELYDPGTGLFTTDANLHTARYFHTATLLNDGTVLVAGGEDNNGNTLRSAEVYVPGGNGNHFYNTNPASNTRMQHTATLLKDGTVLLAGGNEGGGAEAAAEVFDPTCYCFYRVSYMNVSRENHTATLLYNGMVLLAGGSDGGTALATAELYDPTQQTFTPTDILLTARQYHTATLLNSGKVLIAGGLDSAGSPLASAELFSIPQAAATWVPTGGTSVGDPPLTATLLPNGKVLVIGGFASGASAELYDPASGVFSPTGSMSVVRQFHTATLLQNGQVLITGGQNTGNTVSATAELYNPGTGTFSLTGSMSTARSDHTATLLQNGQVLIAGGFNFANGVVGSAEIYDPGSGTFFATGSMQTVREGATATLLNNGKVLVAGGSSQPPFSTLSEAELYDPSSGTFTATGSMNTTRGGYSATLLSDGRVLVIGGSIEANAPGFPITYYASTEIYDPATGQFTAGGNLNTARSGHGATQLANGQVLVEGGYSSTGVLASAEIYDPSTGMSSPAASMNTARQQHGVVLLLNGKVLVVGGYGVGGSAELYLP